MGVLGEYLKDILGVLEAAREEILELDMELWEDCSCYDE